MNSNEESGTALYYNAEAMFPKFHADMEKGLPLTSHSLCPFEAQKRVALRRYIRLKGEYPHLDLKGLGEDTLKQLARVQFVWEF